MVIQMEKIMLQIRNREGEVTRTAEAKAFDIRFGTIDHLMELMDIDENTTSFDMLKKVSTAWTEVVSLLGEIFPDVTEAEWADIRLNDLVPTVFQVVKYTFSEIMSLPTEKN